MLRKLGDTNTRGDNEGVDRGLAPLREAEILRTPDPGCVITDDAQLAGAVAEASCVDRLDNAARTSGRVCLPWY
jgi:hypothetical protein